MNWSSNRGDYSRMLYSQWDYDDSKLAFLKSNCRKVELLEVVSLLVGMVFVFWLGGI